MIRTTVSIPCVGPAGALLNRIKKHYQPGDVVAEGVHGSGADKTLKVKLPPAKAVHLRSNLYLFD